MVKKEETKMKQNRKKQIDVSDVSIADLESVVEQKKPKTILFVAAQPSVGSNNFRLAYRALAIADKYDAIIDVGMAAYDEEYVIFNETSVILHTERKVIGDLPANADKFSAYDLIIIGMAYLGNQFDYCSQKIRDEKEVTGTLQQLLPFKAEDKLVVLVPENAKENNYRSIPESIADILVK